MLAVQLHGAVVAFVTVPLVLLYLVASIYLLALKRRTVKQLGVTILIIFSAYLVIAITHTIRFKEARNNANSLVAGLNQYKFSHGTYPRSIIELGVSSEQLRRQNIYYSLSDSGPVLIYMATQVPFDKYFYNFNSSDWEYRAD